MRSADGDEWPVNEPVAEIKSSAFLNGRGREIWPGILALGVIGYGVAMLIQANDDGWFVLVTGVLCLVYVSSLILVRTRRANRIRTSREIDTSLNGPPLSSG
jgi:hypothetical protein